MFYSPSTGGFYHPAVHGANIPSDAVAISAERHAELFEAQADGLTIVPGPDGAPIAVDPATLRTTEESLEILRVERNRLLAQSDWTQMPDSPLDEAQRAAWSAYRQALRDLPATANPAAPDWPALPQS